MESEVGCVYMITSPSGRIYIGSTKNYKERLRCYKYLKCKAQFKLYNSLVKYGFDNHKIEIVWKGALNERLKYEHLIGIYYECLTEGLNLRLPGYDDVPQIFNQESRERMSRAQKGKKMPPRTKEHTDKIIKASSGRRHSKETKEKIRLSRLGRTNRLGKKHSEESKQKIGAASKGRILTEESRNKMSLTKIENNKRKLKKL